MYIDRYRVIRKDFKLRKMTSNEDKLKVKLYDQVKMSNEKYFQLLQKYDSLNKDYKTLISSIKEQAKEIVRIQNQLNHEIKLLIRELNNKVLVINQYRRKYKNNVK